MTKTKKDFEPDTSSMVETLEQVKAVLRRHFEIKDWQGIELILAMACAYRFSVLLGQLIEDDVCAILRPSHQR